MRSLVKNKKGQFESILLGIITIFIIGILFFFSNHATDKIRVGLSNTLTNSSDLNDSIAVETIDKIRTAENAAWDYGFLAIFVGIIIQIIMFSFATRINVAFFWLMIIIDLPLLFVGVVLSNVWQELASKPEFATTLTRFPITDALLGTYFPTALVIIFFFAAIVLFGKPPGGQSQ